MTTRDEDRELLRRCMEGEEEAWREFVARFQPVIHVTAKVLLLRTGHSPSPDRLDEICARMYERLVERDGAVLRSFCWKSSLSTWLIGIVRNVVFAWLREERRRQGRLREVSLSDTDVFDPDRPEEGEDRQRLRDALARIPEEDRALLTALHVDGRTYTELADETGIPRGTLAVRAARARQVLLTRLKGFFSVLL